MGWMMTTMTMMTIVGKADTVMGNGNHGGGNNSEHRPAAGGAVNVVLLL